MNAIEIIVLALVCAAFAFAVGYLIYRKVKGKSGCDCGGCSGCSSCGSCPHCVVPVEKDEKKKQ